MLKRLFSACPDTAPGPTLPAAHGRQLTRAESDALPKVWLLMWGSWPGAAASLPLVTFKDIPECQVADILKTARQALEPADWGLNEHFCFNFRFNIVRKDRTVPDCLSPPHTAAATAAYAHLQLTLHTERNNLLLPCAAEANILPGVCVMTPGFVCARAAGGHKRPRNETSLNWSFLQLDKKSIVQLCAPRKLDESKCPND